MKQYVVLSHHQALCAFCYAALGWGGGGRIKSLALLWDQSKHLDHVISLIQGLRI